MKGCFSWRGEIVIRVCIENLWSRMCTTLVFDWELFYFVHIVHVLNFKYSLNFPLLWNCWLCVFFFVATLFPEIIAKKMKYRGFILMHWSWRHTSIAEPLGARNHTEGRKCFWIVLSHSETKSITWYMDQSLFCVLYKVKWIFMHQSAPVCHCNNYNKIVHSN